jgi:hypothetical protein
MGGIKSPSHELCEGCAVMGLQVFDHVVRAVI